MDPSIHPLGTIFDHVTSQEQHRAVFPHRRVRGEQKSVEVIVKSEVAARVCAQRVETWGQLVW